MRLERLNHLPLNTVTPKFVAMFVFFGTASSFIERISSSETEKKIGSHFVFLRLLGGEWYLANHLRSS